MPSPPPGQTEIPMREDRLGGKTPGGQGNQDQQDALAAKGDNCALGCVSKGEERDPTPPFSTCLFNLEKGRQWERAYCYLQLPKEDRSGLFLEIFSDSTRTDGCKLEHDKFLLDIRKQISSYLWFSLGQSPESLHPQR